MHGITENFSYIFSMWLKDFLVPKMVMPTYIFICQTCQAENQNIKVEIQEADQNRRVAVHIFTLLSQLSQGHEG